MHNAGGMKWAWLTAVMRMGRAGLTETGAVLINWGSLGSGGFLGISMDAVYILEE